MKRWLWFAVAIGCSRKPADKPVDDKPLVLPAGDARLEVDGVRLFDDGIAQFNGCDKLKRIAPDRVASLAKEIEEGPIFRPSPNAKPRPDCPDAVTVQLTAVIGGERKTATYKACEHFSHTREAVKAVKTLAGPSPCAPAAVDAG